MEQGECSNEFYNWSTDILEIRNQVNEIFLRNNEIYGDQQCVAFKSLVDSTAEYVQLWADSFEEEIKLATAVGKELLRILKSGMELLHCANEGSAKSIFIFLGSAGEFSDIIDAIRRYSQMILRVVKSYPITSPAKAPLLEKLERTVKLDCNMPQNALTSLSAPEKRKWWFRSLKDRLARSKRFSDEKGLSSFVEILERGIIADSDLHVQKFLGNGSYGTVHEARCFDIPVAVKEFIYNDLFDIEYKPFMELMGINSSHIVQILGHSVIKSSGKKALVMELMDMDLRRLTEIKKESNPTSPFTVYEATDIMLQVASGMRELHRIDVIHRDIKPQNILVSTRKDGSFIVKLADFGASKTNFRSQYTYTDHRGTMMYMAPEMKDERGKYTRKVDAYSFGVVYVEILKGRFRKEDLEKQRLLSLLNDIPSGLREVICGCLKQEAKKRPSFKDICNDLWDVMERLLLPEYDHHYLDQKTRLRIPRWQFGKILNLLPFHSKHGGSDISPARIMHSTPQGNSQRQSMARDKGTTLKAGHALQAGDYLKSSNANYQFIMQADCNLVLYKLSANNAKVLWASNTNNKGAIDSHLKMQSDGNLVIYKSSDTSIGNAVWASGTVRSSQKFRLVMQDDGNVVIYTPSGLPIWATGTDGK